MSIKTITSVPPIDFLSVGQPLSAWSISGNSQQNGTPAHDAPVDVQGCGDWNADANSYILPITCGGTTTPVYLGQVQTVRKIRKLVFDGSEQWEFGSYPYIDNFLLYGQNFLRQKINICVCTHLQTSANVQSGDPIVPDTCCFNVDSSLPPHGIFYYKDTSVSSLSDFKSWLQQQYANGTPVTLWYVLAEPETAIVNEPLCKIGDYVDTVASTNTGAPSIPTSEGSNILTIGTTVQPSEVSITYITPNTIAENLQRLQNARTNIATAITTKGGTLVEDAGFEDFPEAIIALPSGGSSSGEKPVKFYDYDGTIVNSYTAEEFANLESMPSNPSHTGLTAQGWNWNLVNAKAYVADYGALNIGQMYITSDGKTRLYISLPEGRTSPTLQLYLDANSELDIDWGDGGAHSTFTSTKAGYKSKQHEYSTAGDYIIAITVVNGSFQPKSSSSVSSILWDNKNSYKSTDAVYNNSIKKVEIGLGITSIGNNAFYNCYSLSSITIPNTVTSIGSSAFSNCYSLSSITLSNTLTSIGNSAFSNCYSLSSITIPNTVTSIGTSAFGECKYMSYIKFESSTPPIVANSNAWSNVSTSTKILVPTGTLETYKAATNYPNSSTYTYEEY